jgi:peptidase C25-like protein
MLLVLARITSLIFILSLAACSGSGGQDDAGQPDGNGIDAADSGADPGADPGSDPGSDIGSDPGSDPGADFGGDLYQPCDPAVLASQNRLAESEMLIVTSTLLSHAFEVLADWKRSKGVATQLVTLDWIDQNVSGLDQAERVRNYIRDLHDNHGLGYVLLGGDADVVPYRLVQSKALLTYDDQFASDFYFSDLQGSWDDDGDGDYGEPGDGLDMHPDLAVGRLPVTFTSEAQNIVSRLLAYEQFGPACVKDALFISEDTGFLNFDSAVQLNPLADDIFPSDFSKQKLYWKHENYDDAEPNTHAAQVAALGSCRSFVTHYGHASEYDLNMEMSDDQVADLANSPDFPIYISCGCQAGNFPFASQDSAAENLFSNPNGGALAYLGNTNIGLGPGGGTAFIESFYKGLFEENLLHIGDALNFARDDFYQNENNLHSELMGIRWTQLVVVLFADPEMPVFTDNPSVLLVDAPIAIAREEQCIEVSVTLDGQPIEQARVTLFRPGDFIYTQMSDADGLAAFRFAPGQAGDIQVTATYSNSLPGMGTIIVP